MFISIRCVHDDYSMLDGMGTVPRYVERARAQGMGALAQTNHGNIAGSHEFYTECIAAGIEPILGCEFYFTHDAAKDKNEKKRERFHVTFLARNEDGYRTLVDLSTETHRQFYDKPLLDRRLINNLSKKEKKNLVVLSGCAGSAISQMLMGEEPGDAHEEINWWKKTFPNFYVELMHHGTDFDRKLNALLINAAKKHKLDWVVTNDPHYVEKNEAHHHDALLTIQTTAKLDDEDRFRFHGKGYWLKSYKEMEKAFKKYGNSIWLPGATNTVKIAESCHTRIKAWDSRTWHIPKFPKTDNPHKELEKRAWKGLKKRGLENKKKYVKRLKHELAQFEKVGMADFLLITADAADAARKKGIRVGPGRGSVCGTLVGWLIGIHKIDPIRYGLLFERFLNPERPKMPDIDTDFPRSRREEMFQYVDEIYGAENTMRVAAFQRMKTKAAFSSLATAYGIPYKETKKLSAAIIEDEEGNAILPEGVEEAYPDLYATLVALSGLKKGISRHPAGVIIFDPDDPIRNLVPEMWIASSKRFVAQYDLDVVAALGLLKQDFLGLRTLDTIQECVDLVKARHGVDIEPDDWVPGEEEDDDKVWKMLREGKTAGVFQMEGGANHRGIQEIKCDGFEDIVSCTSLYRAGPMIAGAPKRFLQNKKDKKIRVAHKSLVTYMQASWGEMIYQEQMFQILNEVAGMSWSRVDDVKTAMAKKDPEKMAKLMDEAVEGFQETGGMSEEKAAEVWMQIAAQAAYLFNRSHAVAYSMLTYQTARLKMLYPLEFCAALLRTVEPKNDADKGKREAYMTEALSVGFKIMPPDVNVSDDRFMPNGKDELLFGLIDITGFGPAAAGKFAKYREEQAKKTAKGKRLFKTVDEVAMVVNNAGVVKALAAAGALRSLGVEPEPEKQEELLGWQFTDKMKPFREKYARKVRLPKKTDGKVVLLGEITRTEKRKTKTGKTFMTWTIRYEPGVEFKVSVWEDADELFPLIKGSIVMVEGKWSTTYKNVGVGNSEYVKIIKKVVAKKAA